MLIYFGIGANIAGGKRKISIHLVIKHILDFFLTDEL